MAHVLVIGGAGFLGRHAIHRLSAAGFEVSATHSPGRSAPLAPGVRWLECDLSSSAATDRWPATCDHVVFLAQARNYRDFPAAAEQIFAVNLAALQQTLSYARRCGARKFVLASSGSVYTSAGLPAQESDVIDMEAARSYYVATKLAAEFLLQPYAQFFSVVRLRIFLPYGTGQNPDMLLPQLVQRVREGRPILLDGADGLRANPLAAPDFAEVVERFLSVDASGLYNVGGPEEVTLRQLGMLLGKVMGREPCFEDRPGCRPPVLVGRTDSLRRVLGWAPATTVEAGLRAWLAAEAPANAAA